MCTTTLFWRFLLPSRACREMRTCLHILAAVLTGGLAIAASATQPHNAAACPWSAGEVLDLTGTVGAGGLSGSFHRAVEIGSGRSTESIDFGVFATGDGYDGELAWSRDVSGATHDLDSGFARSLARSEAWLAAHQGCKDQSGARAQQQPPIVDGSHNFDVWRILPSNGAPVELWYDRATGLPDRAILQYAESRVIHHFADWRDIGGGRMIAFKQSDEDPEDDETTEYRVDHAEVRQTAAPHEFVRSPPPDDVHLPAGRHSTTIAYEDDHRTRIFVPVYVNGAGPFTFEVDAGGHFILAPDTLRTLGLVSQGSFSNTGAGEAISKAGYVRVQQIRIGEATIENLPAKILPLSSRANDRGGRPPRAGIIGLEFFERFTVALDRRAKTMTLTPRGEPYPPPKGVALPLIFTEDAALVAGAYQGFPGDFMLDTGNSGPTIIEQFWAEPNGLSRALSDGIRAAEDVVVTQGEISVGPFRLPNELVSYYGPMLRGSEYTRAVAGILGEPLLSRFDATYDYARKLVWLDPIEELEPLPFPRSGLALNKSAGGNFLVVRVLDNSPAADAGLKLGEIIETVDGKPAATLARSDIDSLFRQDAGTSVRLGFRISADAELQAVELRLRDLRERR